MPVVGQKTGQTKTMPQDNNGQGTTDPVDVVHGGRKVIYPKTSIKLCDGKRDPFLTVDDAKLLLGWQEEASGKKLGGQYTLVDAYGRKVICQNNLRNRGYRSGSAENICQEILRGKWRLNLESMIIGRTGLCLSCQHRLIGLVLAGQKWEQHPEKYPFWKAPPTVACLIAFGCDEDDDTVNTIDTGTPRSLTDVIYRSDFFRDSIHNNHQRSVLSGILSHAVKTVWVRTGVKGDPNSPHRTHSESLGFIKRHPRLLDCSVHIYAENTSRNRITEVIPAGEAAGLMFLMGASATDNTSYSPYESEDDDIDWLRWGSACSFWEGFAHRHKQLSKLFHAIEAIDVPVDIPSGPQKVALVVRAWGCVVAKKPLKDSDLALPLLANGWQIDPRRVPTLGGIDLGGMKDEEDEEVDTDGNDKNDRGQ